MTTLADAVTLCPFQGEYGDVSERKQLRKDLQCKSFEWYLNTIYPDLQIPDYLASGEVCMDHVSLGPEV